MAEHGLSSLHVCSSSQHTPCLCLFRNTNPFMEEGLPTKRRKMEKPCFAFQKGTCARGSSCKFSHEVASGGDIEAVDGEAIPNEDDALEGEAAAPRRVITVNQMFGNFIDRYFTRLYSLNVRGVEENDQYVHMHSNRLALVGLAPSHPIVTSKVPIISINFNVSGKRDLLDNVISGKKKRGGHFMSPEVCTSFICFPLNFLIYIHLAVH
jgi:hypothetical protein